MKAVIFDFNGTLFIDHDKHIEAWGKMSQLLRGQPLTPYELEHYINGVPNKKIIAYLVGKRLDEKEVEKYSKQKEAIYRQCCLEDPAHLKLIDGCIAYFAYLKKNNIPMTICSASIKENIDFFFDTFSLSQWFDYNKVIYDNGQYISKVEMFKDAASVLEVDIGECLVFEDSISGIKSAHEAGVSNIYVIGDESKQEPYLCESIVKYIKNFNDVLE